MPWKDKTVEELRKEFAEAAKHCKSLSALCREFNITRKTGYKWMERYALDGNMSDRSHAPFHVPGKTPTEIEELILRVRLENPAWGAKTIWRFLIDQGYTDIPCERTVNNILKRHGCISEAESEKRQAYVRFQREYCNDLWQIDFKGDFPLLDGTRCYPFDVLDDRSRYCLGIFPKNNTVGVMQSMEQVFKEFGLPKAILSDNGGQFAGFKGGYTQFERWLMDLDIVPLHGRPLHPQTQGKIERFHRTMKDEVIKRNAFADLADADKHLQEWRIKYNEIRPHQAIELLRPADIYIPSPRKFPDRIEPYEYSGLHRILTVNYKGYLRFDRKVFYLSETMIGARLELRPSEGSCATLHYRNYKIAEIDLANEQLINRRIARSE